MGNALPEPCDECRPYGGNWRIVVKRGVECTTRCLCPRGQALSLQRPVPPERAEPVLTPEEASAAVDGLARMPFFPPEPVARGMIGNELMRLCRNSRTCFELVERMGIAYSKWPGDREMRIFYCANFGPPLSGKDLSTTISEFYPEGFGPKIEAAPVRLALPPGQNVSAAPKLEAAIQATSAALPKMPKPRLIGRAEREFDQFLQELMTAPQDRQELPRQLPTNPNYKPLDAVEFARLLAEERAKKSEGAA